MAGQWRRRGVPAVILVIAAAAGFLIVSSAPHVLDRAGFGAGIGGAVNTTSGQAIEQAQRAVLRAAAWVMGDEERSTGETDR